MKKPEIYGKAHILIVSATQDMLGKLKNYFSRHHYKVSALSDFAKIKTEVRKIKPDIIIIGERVYRTVSPVFKQKDTPVVVVKEEHLDLNRLEDVRFGGNCLAYPQDKSSLVSIINFAANCRRHENKLLEDFEWLLAALMNIGDGAIVVDTYGRIVFINTVAKKLSGIGETESIGKNIEDILKIIDDKTCKIIKNPVFASVETAKTVRAPLDISLETPKGKISIGARATPISDKRAKIKGAVFIFWDVTTHLKNKKALEISEEKYRTLVESANSIILRSDFRGEVTFANKFACRFLGYGEKEFLSKNISDFLKPAKKITQTRTSEFARLVCKPKKFSTFELEGRKKNGETVWISWTCKSMQTRENVEEMLWVGNDITGLKNAQHELEKNRGELEIRVKERTAQLADANKILKDEVIFRKKTQNELSKAYQKLKTAHNQLIQTEKMAALGRFASGIAHEIKNPLGIITSGAEFLLLKLPVSLDFTNADFKNKSVKKLMDAISGEKYIDIDKNKSPLENLNSILTASDFYEKWKSKHSEGKLPSDIKGLAEKTKDIRKSKTEDIFISDKMVLKFLNRNILEHTYKKLCPRFKFFDILNAIENIKNASVRADTIVKNLLKFARPSGLKAEMVKPQEIIEESINQIPLREKSNAVFKTKYGRNLFIKVDRNQLMQVLINIIMNAIQSVLPRSQAIVKIGTYRSFFRKVNYRAPACVIEVKDNGIGIEKKDLERLFEPFFTTKTIGKGITRSQGTGLGLSVSKSIIDSHGGELIITSSKGKGTKVKILLPLRKNK